MTKLVIDYWIDSGNVDEKPQTRTTSLDVAYDAEVSYEDVQTLLKAKELQFDLKGGRGSFNFIRAEIRTTSIEPVRKP